MPIASDLLDQWQELTDVRVATGVALSAYTRFGIGGPAKFLVESSNNESFQSALTLARQSGLPHVVIAGGTNLVVSDKGFDGSVLRFTGERIHVKGMRMHVEAGASLQAVVDRSIESSLQGMETMTGIPGSLGAAVYGNAGAYGHSLNERVESVCYTDGRTTHALPGNKCDFEYRGSIFKRRKDWVILSAELSFDAGDRSELQNKALEIRTIRDAKYPPSMKCAGSIFKNCFFRDLPEPVQRELPEKMIRDGKVPSAWFLEQVGAKGIRRGDIQVATYHANLIYNDGNGTAEDLVAVIADLKRRIRDRFGFEIEEEVQYVGFDGDRPA
jgi:UDP-N-acetylmuramate dehydrogenase